MSTAMIVLGTTEFITDSEEERLQKDCHHLPRESDSVLTNLVLNSVWCLVISEKAC